MLTGAKSSSGRGLASPIRQQTPVFLCLAPSESHTKAISLAFDAQLSDGHSLLEQAMLPPYKKVACS